MLNKLTDRQIKAIKNLPDGKTKHPFPDGGGLFLLVRSSAKGGVRKSWIFRYSLNKKRSDLGMGSYPTVSLSEARTMRDRYAKALSAGQDPKAVKDVEMSEALAVSRAAANVPTLENMSHQAFEAIRATLKESAAHRWMTPLRLYVHPTIGSVPITQIDQHVLHDCLKPVWRTKHPSAVKALRRVNIALKHATAAGLDVDLQAAQKAKIILGEVDHEEVGRPSLHYRDAPHFYAQLPNDGAALLLKALMLTGVRSAEMRLARIEKIEWNEAILTSPREIVKGRKRTTKDNRIALSNEAVRVLRCAAGDRTEGHIFRNIQRSAYSDNAVSKLMRDSNWLKEREIKATPHGMRSTFKAFILERHHEIPPHIVELVLSHTIENKVGAAYTRTDQIEQQRCALERWGRFLCGDKTPVIDQFSPDEKKFEAQ